ncbi:MAG: hypothetical protein MZW92_36505 [Comamonadaceae bacterium]|nr:hypothetical protein [Comamonadaceae bacterium]
MQAAGRAAGLERPLLAARMRLTDTAPIDPESSAEPHAVIELHQAVAIIVGIVIGAGIFKAPSMVAGVTGSARTGCSVAWVLGGAAVAGRRAVLRGTRDRLSRTPAATTTS